MQHFTVAQANRMLPLVRRIVADVVQTHERWREAVRAFELASLAARAEAPSAEAEGYQRQAQRCAEDIAGFVRELEALGVELTSYDVGLVDFPARVGDRTVYLCWRLGEPEVRYWHEREDGFAGRRPIEALAFA